MKFICEGCEKPCVLEVGDGYNLTAADLQCVVKNSCCCNWKKYEDGEVANLQPKVAKLPKLTAEVFARPDCPKWAKWAALGGGGGLTFYKDKPRMSKDEYPKRWVNYDRFYPVEGTKFDSSDWENSLIERHKVNWDEVEEILCNSKLTFKERKKELPDWCKVGEWVYYRGYRKIIEVKTLRLVLESAHCGNLTVYPEEIGKEVKQARLRPYNAEEMRGLVGKAICGSEGKIFLVVAYSPNTVLFGDFLHTPEDLTLDIYKFPDGSPCGVLEHMANGEWVK